MSRRKRIKPRLVDLGNGLMSVYSGETIPATSIKFGPGCNVTFKKIRLPVAQVYWREGGASQAEEQPK